MRWLTIAALLVCAGCGTARFDASTEATTKASMQNMTSGMSEAEKRAFASDVMVVAMPQVMSAMTDVMKIANQTKAKATVAQDPSKLMKSLDGMTAAEIHAKAEEIRAKTKKP